MVRRRTSQIDSAADVEQAWRAATALRDRDDLPFAAYYPVREFLAGESLDGPEYSVEAFSFAGRHAVIAVTSKSCAGFIEMGHAQPAALTVGEEDAIAAHVTAFFDAMGCATG